MAENSQPANSKRTPPADGLPYYFLQAGDWFNLQSRQKEAPGAAVTNIAGPFHNGDALNALDAPPVANRSLLVSAEIEPLGTNGVIIAQGANGNGYALYLKNDKPAFAVRSATKLTTVITATPLGSGHFKVAAELAADGAVTISVDDKIVGTGHAPGLIAAQPARGLSVGLNYRPVGDYPAPNPFTGKIENVRVQTW